MVKCYRFEIQRNEEKFFLLGRIIARNNECLTIETGSGRCYTFSWPEILLMRPTDAEFFYENKFLEEK